MSEESTSVETAIRRYRERSVSLGHAAELGGVSVWQFIDLLDERDVEVNYDETDLEDDVRAVKADEPTD